MMPGASVNAHDQCIENMHALVTFGAILVIPVLFYEIAPYGDVDG
jgi:hypothetical protein